MITLTFTHALCREVLGVEKERGINAAAAYLRWKGFAGDAGIDEGTSVAIVLAMQKQEIPEGPGTLTVQYVPQRLEGYAVLDLEGFTEVMHRLGRIEKNCLRSESDRELASKLIEMLGAACRPHEGRVVNAIFGSRQPATETGP